MITSYKYNNAKWEFLYFNNSDAKFERGFQA